MKIILALIILGFSIFQLSGAIEEKKDTDVAQEENQLDLLQIQAVANADSRRKRYKQKKKNVRRKKKALKKKTEKRKARRNRTKNNKPKEEKKKRKKRKKSINIKVGKKRKQKYQRRLRQTRKKKYERQGNCSSGGGCIDLLTSMMKAARKQNTYTKNFNSIVRFKKNSKNKGLKKSNFASNTTDGPFTLLLEAGGGNKSDMSCAGSKINKAAKLMQNLTTQLEVCQTKIASTCNETKLPEIKASWTLCSKSMANFKKASDACLTNKDVCTCFNASTTLKLMKEVENCSTSELLKASNDSKQSWDKCRKGYGECRRVGEDIRPVLSACQAEGRTEEQTKKDVGIVLKNEEANNAILKMVTTLKGQGRRQFFKRADVTFNGATYKLGTCAEWTTAADIWITTLDADIITDISSAGTTIAGTTVTCSEADIKALTALESKAKTIAKKISKKKEMLQKKLEKLSGSTISVTAAQEAAGGGTGANAVTKAGRRRHKILAEFRQRF